MEKPAITFASFQVLEAQVSKYKAVFQGTIESVARSELFGVNLQYIIKKKKL